MSTGQANNSILDDKPASAVHDFHLACYLRCIGYNLIALRTEGRRKVFVFRDRPARHDNVLAFYGHSATVPAMPFSTTLKDMKALLHNA